MIRGSVNGSLEAVLPLMVRDSAGRDHSISAIIDTGFKGFLSLPPPWIASLGLKRVAQIQALLADGSPTVIDVYEASIVWDGKIRTVDTDGVDGPALVGMRLLETFDLSIRVIAGGEATVEQIP